MAAEMASLLEVEGDGKHIAERLAVAASLAPAKSPRPALSDVLIEARDGVLYFTGGDLHVGCRMSADKVTVKSQGRVMVNAARLLSVVREFGGEGTLRLEADTGKLLVRVPGSKLAINAGDPQDYPETPPWPTGDGLGLPAADLALAIERTLFACAETKSRYAMDGVCFDASKGDTAINVVATDGKRLALVVMPVSEPFQETLHLVVPRPGAQVVQRLAAAAGADTWQMHVGKGDGTFIFLSSPAARVWARPVEGHFPPYDTVLKSNPGSKADHRVETMREDFARALRRASLLTSKESLAVRMMFERGTLTMSSRAPEVGEAEITMPLDWTTDDKVERGFNPSLWLDAVKFAPDKFLAEIHNAGPERKAHGPAIVRFPLNDRLAFTYVLMPLNLGAG